MNFSNRRGYKPFDQHYLVYQFVSKITICCLSFTVCMIALLYISAYCCGGFGATEYGKHLDNSLFYNHGRLSLFGAVYEDDKCAIASDDEKYDCYPEDGGNEQACNERGCCWQPKDNKTGLDYPPLNVPWCYYPKSYGGYKYLNISYSKNGVRAFMQRTFPSPYPNDVEILRLDFHYESNDRLHLKVQPLF